MFGVFLFSVVIDCDLSVLREDLNRTEIIFKYIANSISYYLRFYYFVKGVATLLQCAKNLIKAKLSRNVCINGNLIQHFCPVYRVYKL